jgi:hypothetical protein
MVDYKPNTRTYEVSTNLINNYLNMSANKSYTSTTRVGLSPETYSNRLPTSLILAPLKRIRSLITTYLNTSVYKLNTSTNDMDSRPETFDIYVFIFITSDYNYNNSTTNAGSNPDTYSNRLTTA